MEHIRNKDDAKSRTATLTGIFMQNRVLISLLDRMVENTSPTPTELLIKKQPMGIGKDCD